MTDADRRSLTLQEEVVRLLDLSAAQLEAGIGEAERPVQRLTEVFFALSGIASEAFNAIGVPDGLEDQRRAELLRRWEEIKPQVQCAIEAFQFHDRLCQRIAHVRDGLSQIAGLVADVDASSRPTAWVGLHGALRDRYTIDHERMMFDLLVEGRADEALQPMGEAAGGVELF